MVGGKSEREEYLNLYVFDYCVIMLGSESEECCNFRKEFICSICRETQRSWWYSSWQRRLDITSIRSKVRSLRRVTELRIHDHRGTHTTSKNVTIMLRRRKAAEPWKRWIADQDRRSLSKKCVRKSCSKEVSLSESVLTLWSHWNKIKLISLRYEITV